MTDLANMHGSPQDYEKAAFLFREIGKEMLQRLQLMKIEPKLIIDAGCGVGVESELLQQYYPKAMVVGLDHSEAMLNFQANTTLFKVCSLAEQLPFASQSVDMIFANFILPWAEDKTRMMKEWRRVLKPNGLLMFTGLGIDTLRELPRVKTLPGLIDMHDLGDALVQERFADPVMDVDYYTLSYQHLAQAQAELLALQMLADTEALDAWQANAAGKWQITYEIIFGHSWVPEGSDTAAIDEQGEAKISLAQLRKQLRGGG